MTFKDALRGRVLVLDGAMGTMVQNLALSDAAFGGAAFKMLTDLLVFSRPGDLEDIHLQYLKAGADILETDTFGASPLRLREFDFAAIDAAQMQAVPPELDLRAADFEAIAYHLSAAGCRIAAKAVARYRALPEYDGRPLFVAGSIGPSNYVVSSTQANLKQATFRQIVDNVYYQVLGLLDGGADVLLFETQQDILELKAGILGAQKAFREKKKSRPIMAQVTVDQFSKMQIFNTDLHAAYVAVAGMGIDTFGINCTLGPAEMRASVEKLSRFCNLPISIVPNAGQPVSEDGRTCYKLTPEDMAAAARPFVEDCGVAVVGGCCGTTPAHIRALRDAVKGLVPPARSVDTTVYLSGPQNAVALDSSENLVRIGERLNVRGSKKVRDAVETEDGLRIETLEDVVTEQVETLGLNIIDVCMDSNIVETEQVLPRVIHDLTSDFKGAMCIDSFSVEALEQALQTYPGRPIVNSISLEEYRAGESKLDAVLAVTKAHHPVYIALVNGPRGPGVTAREKYDLAAEIVRQAKDKHGVTPDQLLIDLNAYPIGAESVEGLNFCAETLECLPRVKAIHPDLKTTIGVGNLTNGLAQKPYMRQVLTSVFLDEARRQGLDCAILNPNHYVPVESLPEADVALARRVILQRDMDAFEELERIAVNKKTGAATRKTDYAGLPLEARICRKIMDGYKQKEEGTIEKSGGSFPYRDHIVVEAAEAIDRHAPLDFIGDHLMKAMRELGDRFGRGEVSLPHLLKSADVMRHVMRFLEAYMQFESGVKPGQAIRYKGVVVLGTVYQDVHSIGKDLARTLLENYGYRVIDLGVQVPLERFIETAKRENADAIGMSALLVQTSNHMITVSRMLQEQSYDVPILIGGAPVSHRHAGYVGMWGQEDMEKIRAGVFYCDSAMDGVQTMGALRDKDKRAPLLQKNKQQLIDEYRRAKGLEEHKSNLLQTLKRRKVSFKKHHAAQEGYGLHRVEFKLNKLNGVLDSRSLFSLNWKFGKKSTWKQKGVTPEQLNGLRREWMEKAEQNGWIVPQAAFGLFPAQSEGDELIIYDPRDAARELARMRFTVCIGRGQKDTFSVAQYFLPKTSGVMDMAGLQVTTAGAAVERAIAEFKAQDDAESALYLQGLSDRVAEDLAEYIHNLLRQRVGQAKEKFGQRYSPGYAALTDLVNNKIIYEALDAAEIGVTLTGANEFHPPSTTAAVICFHRDAGYS